MPAVCHFRVCSLAELPRVLRFQGGGVGGPSQNKVDLFFFFFKSEQRGRF